MDIDIEKTVLQLYWKLRGLIGQDSCTASSRAIPGHIRS